MFAERGFDAPMELIAREAGVGRGTQHRHFPTRESLVEAIFDDRMDAIAEVVATAPDPDDAYRLLLHEVVRARVADRAFVELFDYHEFSPEGVRQELAERFLAIVGPALRRAQDAGNVRADLRPDDTMLLIDMLCAAVREPGPVRPADRAERAATLVMEAIAAKPHRLALDSISPVSPAD